MFKKRIQEWVDPADILDPLKPGAGTVVKAEWRVS